MQAQAQEELWVLFLVGLACARHARQGEPVRVDHRPLEVVSELGEGVAELPGAFVQARSLDQTSGEKRSLAYRWLPVR